MASHRVAMVLGRYAGLGAGIKLLLASHPTEWHVLGALVAFTATGWIDPRMLGRFTMDRRPPIAGPEE